MFLCLWPHFSWCWTHGTSPSSLTLKTGYRTVPWSWSTLRGWERPSTPSWSSECESPTVRNAVTQLTSLLRYLHYAKAYSTTSVFCEHSLDLFLSEPKSFWLQERDTIHNPQSRQTACSNWTLSFFSNTNPDFQQHPVWCTKRLFKSGFLARRWS